MNVVVIGGGVIGLCTAWYAAERGHHVTVIDKQSAEHQGCSYGNAGMLTPSHFVPLSAPGVVRMALKWMFDAESPFYVRPRLDRELLGWGWRFNRAATPRHVAAAAPLIRDLNLAGLAAYQELSREWADEFHLVERGILMLSRTEHGLEEEARTAALANQLGLRAEVVSREQVAELEPGIKMDIAGGVFYPGDAILTPTLFMRALMRRLRERGVQLLWETEVTGWRIDGDRVAAVLGTPASRRLDGKRLASPGGGTPPDQPAGTPALPEADEYVICGGSWSPSIVRDLRLNLPMQAGKGYSLTLPYPRSKPSRGIILTEARVAVTPMGDALRFGGTMEIAGIDERVNPSRIKGIIKSACRYFPDLTPDDFRGVEPWCGLRPCSPDGLPYVGRFRRFRNLSVATGHAMMGLSLGPITGKLIAQVLSGEPPAIPLETLSPDRYA